MPQKVTVSKGFDETEIKDGEVERFRFYISTEGSPQWIEVWLSAEGVMVNSGRTARLAVEPRASNLIFVAPKDI